ncbi:MAG: HAD family hydrolase [Bacilli bacterium]|nr:HAD family hydrolase [Bacilli bacterium]
MKKGILLLSSFGCFVLSFFYFPTLTFPISYLLIVLSFLFTPRTFSKNSVTFLIISIGCMFLELPRSGYLLFFSYTLLSYLFLLLQHCFYKKYRRVIGTSEDTVIVVAGKLRLRKLLSEIKVGDTIVVEKNQTCFMDGKVVQGISKVDLRNLSGKEEIISLKKGDPILCGSINLDRELLVSVTTSYEDSLFSKYQKAFFGQEHKSFMKMVFPFWVFAFLHLVLLFLFFFLVVYRFRLHALEYGLMILLITFLDFENIYAFIEQLMIVRFQKKGIYVLNRSKLYELPKAKNFIFTKTGVLTLGQFSVTKIFNEQEKKFLEVLAYAEFSSENRIGQCINEYCKEKVKINSSKISSFQQFPNGVLAVVGGKRYLVGNHNFMLENGVEADKEYIIGTNLYVAIGSKCLGIVTLSDQVLANNQEEIAKLRKLGLIHITTFSKDNDAVTRAVSNTLGIHDCYSELTYKDRDFWIQYLKDMYQIPQTYISDEACKYPLDIKILFSRNSNDSGDFVIRTSELHSVTTLYSLSKKYLTAVRSWILLEILIKFLLFFLLLWIRDILVLGSILFGIEILFFGILLPFTRNRKGE